VKKMLCGVVTGPSFEEVQQQIEQACQYADSVELRWDCFNSLDFKISCPIPKIFTLRPLSQGGFYRGSESSRLQHLEKLLELKPDYVDLEYNVSNEDLKRFKKHPVKIILSYHDFDSTPDDLEGLFSNLKKRKADLYKIATYANSTLDSLRMLNFIKKYSTHLIGLCTGEYGTITRILNHWSYASICEPIAKGQLSLKELMECYRFKNIDNETAIFGLIGDPVDKSPSNITHNNVFNLYNQNAVYVKMRITVDELKTFFEEIKSLNFKGLSVTMPLKEAVMPHLDAIDTKASSIGAVNTIVFKDDQKIGFNTDCTGAMNAIEEKMCVKGKKVYILGAGGSAKAIALGATLKGADVTIFNRTEKPNTKQLHEITNDYDILINCTPDEMPVSSDIIKENSIVMDIKSVPKWTELLKVANAKNCALIFGYDMFIHQAIGQFELWSNSLTFSCKNEDLLTIMHANAEKS